MKYKFLMILYWLLLFFNTKIVAQILTQNQFEAKLQGRLQSIGIKLYDGAIHGAFRSQENDSLVSLITPEEIIQRGGNLVIVQKQNYLNPKDTTDVIDSAYYVRFDRDSILTDLGINYSLDIGTDFQRTMSLRAIAPMINKRFLNTIYQEPLFWIAEQDLIKILSPAEIDFVKAYAWFKSFESNPIIMSNENGLSANGQKVFDKVLTDPVQSGWYSLNSDLTSKLLGDFICNQLRHFLFQKYKYGGYVLQSSDGPLMFDSFVHKHKYLVGESIPNWKNPEDPTDVSDTFYWEFPKFFDSVLFERNSDGIKIVFKQNKPSEKEDAPLRSRYFIPLEALKPHLQPAMYKIIFLLI